MLLARDAPDSSVPSVTGAHGGSDTRAGNANQYENLYFFKSAKERIMNEANREGHEYIVPSLIASQTFIGISNDHPIMEYEQRTVLPACCSMVILSISLYSSIVLTFLIMPSAL